MPLYEYECSDGHKCEKDRPMSQASSDASCPECGQVARRIMSRFTWGMGWKFLKWKQEKKPEAPTDSGYYPEWDEAYSR